MKRRMFYLVMITLVLFSASSIVEAMTAERVVENMIASYEKEMKDVEDYTIVTDKATNYFKRTTVEGRTTYKMRSETKVMGIKSVSIYDGVYWWRVDPMSGELKKEKMDYDPHQIIENLRIAQVKYIGTEKVDGHKTHILSVRDLYTMMGADEGMQKVDGRFWVDAKGWFIRKMEMYMEIEDEKGEKITVKSTIRYEDLRKVNGMLMPYRIVMTVPVPGALEMSPEEEQEMRKSQEEMRKGLEEAQRQLEQAPPAMRKMIEKMMKPQMEMMEKMLAGGGIETVTVVKDIKVNTGLSDELFDGSKLKR